jgi:uncharacterized delta-60 repeat protein
MKLQSTKHLVIPFLAFLALIPCFPGCSSDDDDDDTTVVTGNTFLIKEEHDFETGDSVYTWQAPGGAVRVTVDIEDFHHGDVLVTIFDAVGNTIYQKLFWSFDGYWYVGDWEAHDVDFSQIGIAGPWTIELEFGEFAGDIDVFLESTTSGVPDTPEEIPPPSSTSLLLDPGYGSMGRGSYTPGIAAGRKVFVDASGRAVVAGTFIDSSNRRRLAAWRFLASGNLDTTFGTGGVFILESGEQSTGTGLAFDALQNILITGLIDVSPGVTNLVLVRLDSIGDIDETFGAAGTVIVDDGGSDIGNSVAVTGTGRILVAGSSSDPDGTGEAIIVAILPSGILDGTFATGGILRTGGPRDRGWDLAIEALGKILLAGVRGNGLAVWRYSSAGIVDGTFGTGGIAVDEPPSGELRAGRAIALAPDGSIGVAGVRLFTNGIPAQLAVWRYTDAGVPLLSFQTIGFGAYAFPGGPALGTDILFDGSGRILISGITASDGSDDASATLWRLLATGTPDVGLEGSEGTGFTRFDDRSGNASTGASSIAFGAGAVYSTGGGADRSTGAADLLIWKLDP